MAGSVHEGEALRARRPAPGAPIKAWVGSGGAPRRRHDAQRLLQQGVLLLLFLLLLLLLLLEQLLQQLMGLLLLQQLVQCLLVLLLVVLLLQVLRRLLLRLLLIVQLVVQRLLQQLLQCLLLQHRLLKSAGPDTMLDFDHGLENCIRPPRCEAPHITKLPS